MKALSAGLPGLNIREALDRLGGSVEIYTLFLSRFHERYESRVGELRVHLDLGELQEAHRFVHSIKSLAGNLGADELRSRAILLEKAMARGAAVPPEEQVMGFLEELNTILTMIGSYLSSRII